MKSRISSKGQITVPAVVRERLGLRPGSRVYFEMVEGGAVLRKGGEQHPIDRVYGILKLHESTDALIDEMRGPRPRPRRRARRR